MWPPPKRFSTQLVALLLLTMLLGQKNKIPDKDLDELAHELAQLPELMQKNAKARPTN